MPSLTLFAVPEGSPRIAEAEQTGWMVSTIEGPLNSSAQAQAWQSLYRGPGQVVWVYWAGLEPPDLASLRRFRVGCPTTRVIVEVPEALTPPDDTLAQVVSLGIWDIVRTGGTPMQHLLDYPATYADAAVWQGTVHPFEEPEPVPATIVREVVTVPRETIVEKRVPLTNRSVLIAIWGAIPGTGASTLSVAIGRLLRAYGSTVVLDHAPLARRGAWVVEGLTGLATLQMDPHLPRDLTLRPTTWEVNAARDGHQLQVPDWRTTLQERSFSYVVVDAGLLGDDAATEDLLRTADLNLLLLPPATRMQGCWAWVDPQVQQDRRLTTAVLGASQAEAIRRLQPNSHVLALPWPHESDHAAALESWLAPVLPDPVASSLWGFRRRCSSGAQRRWGAGRAVCLGGLGIVAMGLLWWGISAWVVPHPAPPHGLSDWLHQASHWPHRVDAVWRAKGRAVLDFLHSAGH